MKKLIICLFLIPIQAYAQNATMNGIELHQFGDFTKSWNLVTVRFRQDSHELRFTYANPIAWEALKQGAKIFPEGSVFAKVGFKAGVDPAFNSSIVPSGARRFQYMVKDSKKYGNTDGWGYALFDSEGKLMAKDIPAATQACHACHQIVPERNFVFSEPIEKSPLLTNAQKTYDLKKNYKHLLFSTMDKKNFLNNLKKYYKETKLNRISFIDGELRTFFFGGTIDEVTPLLIRQSIESKEAAGFLSADQNTFKIVKLEKKNKKCSKDEHELSTFEFREEWSNHKKLKIGFVCYLKDNI